MVGTDSRIGSRRQAAVFALALVVTLILYAAVSRADDGHAYDPVSESGLVAQHGADQNEPYLNWYSNPLLAEAEEQTGFDFSLLFTVDDGMCRLFKYTTGTSSTSYAEQYEEWALTPRHGPTRMLAAPIQYGDESEQLLIGTAYYNTDRLSPEQAEILRGPFPDLVVLRAKQDGEFRIVDNVFEGVGLLDIYVLDMTGDGKLELAIHWCGASSEGLLVYTLEPDGHLTPAVLEGSADGPGFFWAHYHEPVIVDFDGDGRWEVEVHDWYQGAHDRTYWCSLLWSFDPARGVWVIDHDKFSDYYQPQAHVYQGLLDALNDASNNLDKYRHVRAGLQAKYACQIDGHWYPLDPFINNGEVMDYYLDEIDGLADWVYRMTGIRIQ
jgi:hypothetical protein